MYPKYSVRLSTVPGYKMYPNGKYPKKQPSTAVPPAVLRFEPIYCSAYCSATPALPSNLSTAVSTAMFGYCSDGMETSAAGASIAQPLANAIPSFLPVFLNPHNTGDIIRSTKQTIVTVTMNHRTKTRKRKRKPVLEMIPLASRFVGVLFCPILCTSFKAIKHTASTSKENYNIRG